MTSTGFRDWRRRLGLTQADAARALGLAVATDGSTSDAIRHYERGSRRVPEPVALLCRYVETFGVRFTSSEEVTSS